MLTVAGLIPATVVHENKQLWAQNTLKMMLGPVFIYLLLQLETAQKQQ